MSLLSYSVPSSGPVKVLVSLLESIPLVITVYDSQHVVTSAELVDNGEANTITVGPGTGEYSVMLRAVNRPHGAREAITSVLPGTIFSRTARVGGNSRVVQCGGDMWMGDDHGRTGARLGVSRGSTIAVATSGQITVQYNGRVMDLSEAAELDLLEVEV